MSHCIVELKLLTMFHTHDSRTGDMHFQISEKSSYLLLVKVGALSQIGLELRYGREDEELMGLQFCNEMILASQSLYCTSDQQDDTLENLTESAGCYLKHFKIGN